MIWPFTRRGRPRKDTDYEREILKNVAEHGCHIRVVFDPEGDSPSHAYSAGVPETVGQPEVILFGLPNNVMHFMVNETLDQCREGLRLENGIEIEGLLDGHRCIARGVNPAFIVRDYFNSAMWLRRRLADEEPTRAFQIVWPGAIDGLFPWDPDCADDVRRLQPALYEGGAIQ